MLATARKLVCLLRFPVFSHRLWGNSSFGRGSCSLGGQAMLGGFVVPSNAYWLGAPLTGVSISLGCYVASIGLSLA